MPAYQKLHAAVDLPKLTTHFEVIAIDYKFTQIKN
jgi:hypothetical protein